MDLDGGFGAPMGGGFDAPMGGSPMSDPMSDPMGGDMNDPMSDHMDGGMDDGMNGDMDLSSKKGIQKAVGQMANGVRQFCQECEPEEAQELAPWALKMLISSFETALTGKNKKSLIKTIQNAGQDDMDVVDDQDAMADMDGGMDDGMDDQFGGM